MIRLLLDENISFRAVPALEDLYTSSVHVRSLGLLGAGDTRIWRYAAEHQYLLVSKDTDFFERSIALGAPPKVVWLRIGNATVRGTVAFLRDKYLVIRRFAEDPAAAFLPLGTS